MNEVNLAVDKLDEVAALAKRIHELYDEGIVINISGIGEPTVLLNTAGRELMFPALSGEPRVTEDGERYTVYDVRAGGVHWKCWEMAEDV